MKARIETKGTCAHLFPVHTIRKSSEKRNGMQGLHNLMIIIAILSIGRFIIDNNREFGFLMSLPFQTLSVRECSYLLAAALIAFFRSLIGFYIERCNLSISFVCLNLIVSELLVSYVNLRHVDHIYSSGWSMLINVIYTAKLISFHLVVRETKKIKGNSVRGVLRFKHFLYFLAVPTLCFQAVFPMRVKRNFRKIFLRMFQFLIGSLLFLFIMDQYAIPSIYRILDLADVITVLENVINLSISTVILFLLFFYAVFYCLLDVVAELTLFYDSNFYQAWWNASSAKEFWALWNRPMHLWIKRHLYSPMVDAKISKDVAGVVVFTLSGLVHEYVISICTKKLNGWFLASMLCQIPLIHVTEAFKNTFPNFGNLFFWATFCVIGQPSVMLLYYRSLYLKRHCL